MLIEKFLEMLLSIPGLSKLTISDTFLNGLTTALGYLRFIGSVINLSAIINCATIFIVTILVCCIAKFIVNIIP